MPGLLARVIAGHDSIGNYEAAAEQRFREAVLLQRQGLYYAAIYLYGYAIEMWIKAAYFHNENMVQPGAGLEMADLKRAWDHQQAAGVTTNRDGFHDLSGWARLLTYIRSATGLLPPFTSLLKLQIERVADAAREHWGPQLRYRHLAVTSTEWMTVFKAVGWFRKQYNNL